MTSNVIVICDGDCVVNSLSFNCFDSVFYSILYQFITFSDFRSLSVRRPGLAQLSRGTFNRGFDNFESQERRRPAENKPTKKKPVYVRKEFPETWLWTEKMVE